MAAQHNIGLAQALELMFAHLPALSPVACPIEEAGGLVLAQDCLARVDCPASATSLKDGYAVCSSDLDGVSEQRPVKLELCGAMVAGGDTNPTVTSGKTPQVRMLFWPTNLPRKKMDGSIARAMRRRAEMSWRRGMMWPETNPWPRQVRY